MEKASERAAAKKGTKAKGTNGVKKRECPVSRKWLKQNQARLPLDEVQGLPNKIDTKDFSTGSVGWFQAGKGVVSMGGEDLPVQYQISMQIIGSKELPPLGGKDTADDEDEE